MDTRLRQPHQPSENAKAVCWHTGCLAHFGFRIHVVCVSALSDPGLSVPADEFDGDEYEERRGIYRSLTGELHHRQKSRYRFSPHNTIDFCPSGRACSAAEMATVNTKGKSLALCARTTTNHNEQPRLSNRIHPAAINRGPSLGSYRNLVMTIPFEHHAVCARLGNTEWGTSTEGKWKATHCNRPRRLIFKYCEGNRFWTVISVSSWWISLPKTLL